MGSLFPFIALSLAAAAANPWLEGAKTAYARLDCDRVLSNVALAKQVPTNDLPTQLSILDYAGRCHVALGHRADADAAFSEMLALDPRAELDEALSPKIRDVFRAAKLRLYPADYLSLTALPASEGLLRATLVDPWRRVAKVVLGRWDEGSRRFDEEPLALSGGVYLAQLSAATPFYVEARGADGRALAQLGHKDAPAAAARPSLVPAAPPTVAATGTPPAEAAKRVVAPSWVVLGTGIVAAVTGGVLLAVAGNTRASAEKAAWAADAVALDQQATAQRGWGTGVLVGGAAVAATGAVLAW